MYLKKLFHKFVCIPSFAIFLSLLTPNLCYAHWYNVFGKMFTLLKSVATGVVNMSKTAKNGAENLKNMFHTDKSASTAIGKVNAHIQTHDKAKENLDKDSFKSGEGLSSKVYGNTDTMTNKLDNYKSQVSQAKSGSFSSLSSNSLNHGLTYGKNQEEASKNYVKYASGAGIGIEKPKASWKPTPEVIAYYGHYTNVGSHMSNSSNILEEQRSQKKILDDNDKKNSYAKNINTMNNATSKAATEHTSGIMGFFKKVHLAAHHIFTIPITIGHVVKQTGHIVSGIHNISSSISSAKHSTFGKQQLQNAKMSQPGADKYKKNGQE